MLFLCLLHAPYTCVANLLTFDRRVRTLTGKEIDLGKTLTNLLHPRGLVGPS